MKIILILILAIVAGAMCYFIMMKLIGEKAPAGKNQGRTEPVVMQTDIRVGAASVVKIRHASDGISMEFTGPEPVYGPLSDASLTDEAWDRVADKSLPKEERLMCAAILREQGIHVWLDFEGDAAPPEEDDKKGEPMDSEFFDSLQYEHEDPEGDLVYEPLCDDPSAYIMSNIVSWLKSRRCSPALAAEIAKIHNILLEFTDEMRRRQATDPDEVRKVQRYDELIAADVDKAMDAFNRDYPPEPDQESPEVPVQEQQAAPPARQSNSVAGYDWGKLR